MTIEDSENLKALLKQHGYLDRVIEEIIKWYTK
jgi:hypothetical protein